MSGFIRAAILLGFDSHHSHADKPNHRLGLIVVLVVFASLRLVFILVLPRWQLGGARAVRGDDAPRELRVVESITLAGLGENSEVGLAAVDTELSAL